MNEVESGDELRDVKLTALTCSGSSDVMVAGSSCIIDGFDPGISECGIRLS